MFVLSENDVRKTGFMEARELKFGDTFIQKDDELVLENVKIAVCEYSDSDDDIVYVPLVPKETHNLQEFGDIRSDNYISSSGNVCLVKVVVEGVSKNV